MEAFTEIQSGIPADPAVRGVLGDLLAADERRAEQAAVAGMRIVAGGVVALVLCLFLFVFREAWPLMSGQVTTARKYAPVTAGQFEGMTHEERAKYLRVEPARLLQLSPEAVTQLAALRDAETREASSQPDAGVNAASWQNLLFPRQWNGYDRPEYIWQPNSKTPKFNIMPLLVGSLRICFMALAVALPLGFAAALFVSQFASPKVREWVKPVVELLAGCPTVVIGFFGLLVVASMVQATFGLTIRLNAFVAGMCVALAVIPTVFSISEEALSGVSESFRDAARALGADEWQSALRVVVPAAAPGLMAATASLQSVVGSPPTASFASLQSVSADATVLVPLGR